MSKRHIFFITIFFSLLLSSTTNSYAQNDKKVGCCEKTEIAAPNRITTMDSDKATCDLTGQQGPWTVRFMPDYFANADKCDKKIASKAEKLDKPIPFVPRVSIPDTNYTAGQEVGIDESTSALANYIVAIFKYSTGVIGIIAAIVLMLAGIMWVTAAGNQEQIGSAKKMIGGGLMGLILTLGSFVILSMVNTNLVNLKITPVTKIKNIDLEYGCCAKTKTVNGAKEETAEELSKEACNRLEGYDSVNFIKDWKSVGNKCIDPFGCCKIQSNSYQFMIFEGDTKSEICYDRVYEESCEDEATSAFRQWGIGVYWQGIDMINQINKKGSIYDIVGDIDTEWQRGRCYDWNECEGKIPAEAAIPLDQ